MQSQEMKSYLAGRNRLRTRRQVAAVFIAATAAAATAAHADSYTWNYSGPSTSVSWGTPGNWYDNTTSSSAAVFPNASNATVTFGDTGTSGKTISIGTGNTYTVASLQIATSNLFSISLGTLATANFFRSSSANGAQTIASAVSMTGNMTLDVSGGAYLNFTGAITDTSGNGYGLTKTGTGEVRFAGGNSYTGPTSVVGGILRVTSASSKVFRNILTIGNGTDAAAVIMDPTSSVNSIANDTVVTVNTNAALTLTGSGSTQYLQTLNVAGGSVDLNGGSVTTYNVTTDTVLPTLSMTGGLISNGTLIASVFPNADNSVSPLIVTNASANTATISATVSLGSYTPTIIVNDGSAAIDLLISGKVTAGQTFNKAGAGVLALTSSTNDYYKSGYVTSVTAGTLLANNVTGSSATGKGGVVVSAGATLGGTGQIGGVGSAYSAANVTLGGSVGNFASLAPGSVDSNSASTVDTLTVGDSTQSNSVTFGNYSALVEQVGNAGSSDKLAITGALNLNSVSNQDTLTLVTVGGASPSGTYVLVTFTGLLSGRFDSVTLNGAALPSNLQVQYLDSTNTVVAGTANYTGGSIVLVPEPTFCSLAGIGVVSLLSRRARRHKNSPSRVDIV